jgi:hypothetical protein
MLDRRALISGAASLVASAGAACGESVPTSGRSARAPSLRRGVNIHHMLNWPRHQREQPVDYVWPPFATLDYSTSSDTLAALQRVGFTFVRLTLDPAIFIASDAGRRQGLVAIVLDRVGQIMGAGFEVVVDLHPVAENPAYAPAQLTMIGSPVFPAYLEIAAMLAGALGRLPPEKVALELMNEPLLTGPEGVARWQGLQQSLYSACRMAAPDLALVLTGANWSAARELTAVDTTPFRAGNVIYAFHYYDPHIFTHQGVSKAIPERYFDGLLWPPNRSQADQVAALVRQRIDADQTLSADKRGEAIASAERALARYLAFGDGDRKIHEDFAMVARWAEAHGVAGRVLLGEFGANQSATETPAQQQGRMDWLAAVRRGAEAEGFGWAYWALEDVSANRGGFRLLPAGSEIDFEPGVLRSLFG